jgi:hypothetical protein
MGDTASDKIPPNYPTSPAGRSKSLFAISGGENLAAWPVFKVRHPSPHPKNSSLRSNFVDLPSGEVGKTGHARAYLEPGAHHSVMTKMVA